VTKVDGEALVPIAVVARPHGVRGEVRVNRLNPESTLLYEVDSVVVRHGGEDRTRQVEGARQGPKGVVLMRFAGVSGRENAEALRGAELLVPRAALPPTEEDEWYFVDLIGLAAFDAEGGELGRVVDVLEYPTIDCLAVHDGREVREVPLAEPYLLEVRLDEGKVILSSIDDLPARKPTKHERQR
jgi:16S rRNA processing protein RimM